jgi:hypothetical protein
MMIHFAGNCLICRFQILSIDATKRSNALTDCLWLTD